MAAHRRSESPIDWVSKSYNIFFINFQLIDSHSFPGGTKLCVQKSTRRVHQNSMLAEAIGDVSTHRQRRHPRGGKQHSKVHGINGRAKDHYMCVENRRNDRLRVSKDVMVAQTGGESATNSIPGYFKIIHRL